MKKIYLQPRVTDLLIEPCEIIASSAFTLDSDGNLLEGVFQNDDATEDALSRPMFSTWRE